MTHFGMPAPTSCQSPPPRRPARRQQSGAKCWPRQQQELAIWGLAGAVARMDAAQASQVWSRLVAPAGQSVLHYLQSTPRIQTSGRTSVRAKYYAVQSVSGSVPVQKAPAGPAPYARWRYLLRHPLQDVGPAHTARRLPAAPSVAEVAALVVQATHSKHWGRVSAQVRHRQALSPQAGSLVERPQHQS